MLRSFFARASVLAATAFVPFVASCTTGADAGTTNADEKTTTTSAALTIAEYTWDQYQGHATVMWPVSQGLCLLTGMTGNFRGTGEDVEVDMWNGYWVLNGSSGQQDVSARAKCIAWGDLGGYGYGTQGWFVDAYGGNGCPPWPFACGSTYYPGGPVTMWNNYNFCSLSRITGAMNGGGEWAESWFDGSNWHLESSTGVTQNYLAAQATCVGLKLPHPLGFTAPVYWSQAANGGTPQFLANVSDAFCGLELVQGAFRGGGEHVDVVQLGGAWYLTGSSYQQGTAASAQCIYLHQY